MTDGDRILQEEESFFERLDGSVFPLYRELKRKLEAGFPGLQTRVQKSQVTFDFPHPVFALWPPGSRIKGRPKGCLVLTFGLSRPLDSPRILQITEPYPGRFTHHLLLNSGDELDREVFSWLREAKDWADIRARKRKK